MKLYLYCVYSNFEWGLSYKKIESHGNKFYILVTPSRVNKSDFRDWWLHDKKDIEEFP